MHYWNPTGYGFIYTFLWVLRTLKDFVDWLNKSVTGLTIDSLNPMSVAAAATTIGVLSCRKMITISEKYFRIGHHHFLFEIHYSKQLIERAKLLGIIRT